MVRPADLEALVVRVRRLRLGPLAWALPRSLAGRHRALSWARGDSRFRDCGVCARLLRWTGQSFRAARASRLESAYFVVARRR
jgi:hypothetical protein